MRIFPREKLRQFLEMIKPLEGSVMREICESHELLRNQREELRTSLKAALSFIKESNSDAKIKDEIETTLRTDERFNPW